MLSKSDFIHQGRGADATAKRKEKEEKGHSTQKKGGKMWEKIDWGFFSSPSLYLPRWVNKYRRGRKGPRKEKTPISHARETSAEGAN